MSGGQTVVDRAVLDVAMDLAPPAAADARPGERPKTVRPRAHYPLEEPPSGGYRPRTIQNVLGTDGTFIL